MTAGSPAFVKLCVPDMDEAARFYAEVFALEAGQGFDGPEFRQVTMAAPGNPFGVILQQWKAKPMRDLGDGWGPLGFATQDFDGLMARATAAGATIRKGPVTAGATRFAIVETPHGHALELIQHG